jgi:hypothetical protein
VTSSPSATEDFRPALAALAASQDGVVARAQLAEVGVPRSFVRGELRARRWQRPFPRTYVTFTGPLPFRAKVWAALLFAGDEAVASHGTAGHLQELVDKPPARIDVLVHHGHRVRPRPGIRVRQTRRLELVRHPARTPPQTHLEDTVLDLSDEAKRSEAVVDVVLAACQRRLTTPARLALRARGRKRLRWRRFLTELLAEVGDGVLSPLERRYYRDIEKAHGLPRGRRNRPEGSGDGRRYRDVRYRRWRVLVELDGRAAHPPETRELDDVRDNEVVAEDGTRTLRYGWRSVSGHPCVVADQVVDVLRSAGWTGAPVRCGPDCALSP